MEDPREPTVRDSCTVTVSTPVDGTRRRRAYAAHATRAAVAGYHVQVNPLVMEAAKRLLQPGQRLVIVSESEVRLINS
jgi:transcription termination factor Rho